MVPETTLHFFCGKMAAGKSTLAIELAKDNNAILLIEDDWLSHLYPDKISDIQDYIRYSVRLKNLVSGHVVSLLSHGVSVVLDFPANTKDQRNWFRAIYERANASHTLHFVDVSNDICKRQLKERSRDKPEGSAFTSDAEFYEIKKYFQKPSEVEGFNIIRYQR